MEKFLIFYCIKMNTNSFVLPRNEIENTSYSGWNNHSDLSHSPKTYSRYLSGKSHRDAASDVNSQAYSSAFESIKALRASLEDNKKTQAER